MLRKLVGTASLAVVLAAAMLVVSPGVFSGDDHPAPPAKDKADKGDKAKEAPQGDAYPLDTCPVDDAKLDAKGQEVVFSVDGRELRFCGAECLAKFHKAKADCLKKLDDAIIAQQTPCYPLEKCMISGDKLGEEGKPVDRVYGNRLVRFCCPHCVKQFDDDKAKYMAELDKAVIAKQMADYPCDTCVVSGDKLNGDMGKPVDYVHANRLVRFCCPECIKTFRKSPGQFMAKIDEATKKKPAKPDEKHDGKTDEKHDAKSEHPQEGDKEHPKSDHPDHPKK